MEKLMDEMLAGALFCSRLWGKSRGAGKGERFSFAPKARLYGFTLAQRAVVWFY